MSENMSSETRQASAGDQIIVESIEPQNPERDEELIFKGRMGEVEVIGRGKVIETDGRIHQVSMGRNAVRIAMNLGGESGIAIVRANK